MIEIEKIFNFYEKMWYHDSNLYRNFNEDDEIPTFENKVTKPDTSISSIEDLIWLLNTMTFWDYTGEIPRDVFMYAYENENLRITVDMPEYFSLFRILKMISEQRFGESLENNYLFETFKFLVDLKPQSLDDKYYCNYAAWGGHLNCLKYAREHGCPWDEWVCIGAVQFGYLDCLRYTHENGCPWDKSVCFYAAKNGHLDCLKYAHEKECPWDEFVCDEAAKNGDLNCLKYAHENGCSWCERVCTFSAWLGYLDILKYAHEHGCPWDKWVCTRASQFGHLHCLKYAHENGCPWDKELCIKVSKNNEIKEYVKLY